LVIDFAELQDAQYSELKLLTACKIGSLFAVCLCSNVGLRISIKRLPTIFLKGFTVFVISVKLSE
jgi:hypothetical protein